MFSGCEFAPPHAASSTLARSAISAATSNVARLGSATMAGGQVTAGVSLRRAPMATADASYSFGRRLRAADADFRRPLAYLPAMLSRWIGGGRSLTERKSVV